MCHQKMAVVVVREENGVKEEDKHEEKEGECEEEGECEKERECKKIWEVVVTVICQVRGGRVLY